MLLSHHDLGGSGPILLLLHGNGLNGGMMLPVARSVSSHFCCIAIDLPGHGDSDAVPVSVTDLNAQDFVTALLAKINALGLRGCFCFGHSLGGAVALLAEAVQPGTFSALYCWEPIVAPPDLRAKMVALGEHGPPLENMALKRRDRFPSAAKGVAFLSKKPPFNSFDEECTRLYFLHGTKEDAEGGGVVLRCTREVEAAVYRSLMYPAALQCNRIRCPVTLGVGGVQEGLHARLQPMAVATASRLPHGCLIRFSDLSHFGPFEKPLEVGLSVMNALLGTQKKASRL
jgi:pimeloyl-ACP methyl ester carboxylesterase